MLRLAALTASLLLLSCSPAASSLCPDGWDDESYIGMGCLLFLSNTTFTWDKANTFCQSYSAKLLEITTESEMEVLHGTLITIEEEVGHHYWWTSGTDVGTDGDWRWATSYTPVGEFIWSEGYPSSTTYRNCLLLNYNLDYTGYNENCEAGHNPICQIK
jgi:hypothetical protein